MRPENSGLNANRATPSATKPVVNPDKEAKRAGPKDLWAAEAKLVWRATAIPTSTATIIAYRKRYPLTDPVTSYGLSSKDTRAGRAMVRGSLGHPRLRRGRHFISVPVTVDRRFVEW